MVGVWLLLKKLNDPLWDLLSHLQFSFVQLITKLYPFHEWQTSKYAKRLNGWYYLKRRQCLPSFTVSHIYLETHFALSTASPKATSIISVQQKQSSLLICNNPNVEKLINPIEMATQPVNPIGSTAEQANPDVQRKRTRGVQSSILTAMALKEKRATLSEAKDIRKVPLSLFSNNFIFGDKQILWFFTERAIELV